MQSSQNGRFVALSVVVDGMLVCTGCHVSKPTSEYSRNRCRKTGFQPRCKACVKAWIAKRYAPGSVAKEARLRRRRDSQNLRYRTDPNFRNARIDRAKADVATLRDAAFQAYGGFVCACCGETERAFLQLDHIANDGCKHRKEYKVGGPGLYRWLKRAGYPPILQVLCANCNFGKRMNGGVCPHAAAQYGIEIQEV